MILKIDSKAQRTLIWFATLAMVAACTPTGVDQDTPLIVATTSILGDVVANVVTEPWQVEVLIPAGADPHDFSPSARQASSLNAARLVVANGLGLEEGMVDLLDRARSDGVDILELGPSVDPLPLHDSDLPDPHFWHDPARMAKAVSVLATKLDELGIPHRASDYIDQIEAMAARGRRRLNAVPAGQRLLITNHDSLGYFADAFDLEVAGVIIPGGSTLASPSAAELGSLVLLVNETGAPAIFVESTGSDRLAEVIAAETGRQIETVELFAESLGPPGSGADSYLGLLDSNTRLVAEALKR